MSLPFKAILPLALDRIDPLPEPPEHLIDLEHMIDRRVERQGECLLWTGPVNQAGLPIAHTPDNNVLLSLPRLQYVRHAGPIADGLVIGTTCGNRRCLEPAHLVARPFRWYADRVAAERKRNYNLKN